MALPRSGRAFDRDVLAAADAWGAGRCGVALLDRDGLVAERGSRDAALPWASVTKLATAWTSLIAVDRGLVALDDAGRAAGLDRAPSPRPRLGPRVRRRDRRLAAGPDADLLEHRLRRAGRHGRGRGRAAVRRPAARVAPRAARDDRRAARRPAVAGPGRDAARPRGARVRAARPAAGGGRTRRRSRRRSRSPGCAGSSPGSGCRTPTTGASGRRSATARRRTGRGAATRRGRSGTSAAAAPSCGSTRTRGSRSSRSRTGRSAPGRSRRGRGSRTRCSRRLASALRPRRAVTSPSCPARP